MKSKVLGLMAVGLLVGPLSANAAPINFEFDMPAFQGGTFGGQTSLMRLTVDNGLSSVSNQTYQNIDISAATVTVGSNLFSVSAPPDTRSTGATVVSWIITDAIGTPTLTLSGTSGYTLFFGSTYRFQLASNTVATNYTNYALQEGDSFLGYYYTNPGPTLTGRLVSAVPAVPEPGTLALLGLGLAGLGLSRRRRAN